MGGSGTARTLNLTLRVRRQKIRRAQGRFVSYEARDISTDMSFLEMLDVVNEGLIQRGEEPIAFDHDCREGICGQCGVVINGELTGPRWATTTCQLHMRSFKDGDALTIEPWRAAAFPVIKDLMVDRSAFDRIVAAGGFISVHTGNAPDANAILVPKDNADLAMDAAACIGCGAWRRRLPQRLGRALRRGEGGAPQLAPAGAAAALPPRRLDGPSVGLRRIRELHEPRRM